MKPENLRITLGYLNGDMHVLNNNNIIFLFDVGRENSKPPIVIVENFPIELILFT